VDLDLTPDQELYRATTARFIADSCPLERIRGIDAGTAELDDTYLARAGELGWFAGLVPEAYGGGSVSDSGLLDAVIVAEERGRFLQPGAFVPANVVARTIASIGGPEQLELLPGIAAGTTTATWAVAGSNGSWDPGRACTASRHSDGLVLDGVCSSVQDAATSDWILVTAAHDEGLVQLLVPATATGLTIEPLQGLDLTRRFFEVRFDGVVIEDLGQLGTFDQTASIIDEQFATAIALTVAESLGAMRELFTTTLEYAKVRTAFGRPIGSFQAIKHLLADTSLLVEECAAVVSSLAHCAAEQQTSTHAVASLVKAFVGESAIEVAQNCLQTVGGIGYSWEHDLHLYMRRLTTDAALYGNAAWHRERLCRLQGLADSDEPAGRIS
jgi:alkylation response protein AidB-like acyl-CoA dehydrogenase